MQGTKEKFNKDIEIPENNKPKMLKVKSTINQIKNLEESVSGRLKTKYQGWKVR
jgi:hypothetical protein